MAILTATSSSTGGFVNSYSYNNAGDQTNRTLSGTSWTLAYDYEGQLTSTATGGSTVSSTNPYKFAANSGYRDDGDCGLTHVGARYYDAQVGRFITRDTFLDQHPYLYCKHDPVNQTDPSGHFGTWQEIVGVIAYGLGGILLIAAIVLSGSDGDGSIGIKHVKEQSGPTSS